MSPSAFNKPQNSISEELLVETALRDAEASAQMELAPDYYLQHFQALLAHVSSLYQDILSPEELGFIRGFSELSHGAACLLTRLLCRKGDWFRLDKLSYREIADLQAAADELVAKGMLLADVPPFEDFAKGVTLAELRALLQEGGEGRNSSSKPNKSHLVAELDKDFERIIKLQSFPWVKLNCREPVATLILCYFGNSYQELSQFVLVDIGVQRFEPYPILPEDRKFDTRAQIDGWQQLDALQRLASEMPEQLLTNPILNLLMVATDVVSLPLKGKLERCRNTVARQLERMGEYETALRLYQLTSLPPARERAVRCLEQLERLDEAVVLLSSFLEAEFTDGSSYLRRESEELECLKRLARRLGNKAKKANIALPEVMCSQALKPLKLDSVGVGVHRLEIPQSGSAEQSLVDYINLYGWQGYEARAVYAENQLLCALFGLAFWDIIFARRKGQFVHPFQAAPLDMFHPGFKPRREALIDQRLAELSDGNYSSIELHLNTRQGIANVWVNWKWLKPELIHLLLETLSAKQITELMRLILNDPRFMRSGMPDLLVACDTSTGVRLEWVEVKGPGDSLRDNQGIWLSKLAALGLGSHLCYLSWSDEFESIGL